jgi:hypothetical protein
MNELSVQKEMSSKTNAELIDIIIRLLKLLGLYELKLGCFNAHNIIEGDEVNEKNNHHNIIIGGSVHN